MEFQLSDGRQESLKRALYNEYGSPDKRIKRLEKIHSFIIDDRKASDHGADKKIKSWFCAVFAEPLIDGRLKVTLRGNVPMGSSVEAWIQRHNTVFNEGVESSLELVIEKGKQADLHDLATALRETAKRPDAPRNYYYVCPRTADILERLRTVLDKTWSI